MKHKFEPHLQLKAIRKVLDITQEQFAKMLGFSYPYLLAVETGQRNMSGPLARKISRLLGVPLDRIRNKHAPAMSWDRASNKLVPFSLKTFEKHGVQLPVFLMPDDSRDLITPTLKDYTKAFDAVLDSAVVVHRLGAVIQSFLELFNEHFRSDAAIDAFLASYKKLYPGDKRRLGARALIGYIYHIQELESYRPEKPKKRRNRRRI
jgi:transcriptional regulator with XRE-family HTH domain